MTAKADRPFGLDIVDELKIAACVLPEASSAREILLRAATTIETLRAQNKATRKMLRQERRHE